MRKLSTTTNHSRNRYQKNLRLRNAAGTHLIELAASAVALSVMAMFCLDACVVLIGYQFNDACCRDAARAASQARDAASALKVARTTASAHKADGYFCSQPNITDADVMYQDYGGNISSTNVPHVTVKTTCNVKMPAPLFFLGANLKDDGTFQSISEYTFPITNININIPGESP
ncbi:MAG: hypothetical protein K2X77_20030 [Candidatus Obscuribacterales bacterium]|nr:hypothetical protein [Candidatus Obscuribacterales bacterium]